MSEFSAISKAEPLDFSRLDSTHGHTCESEDEIVQFANKLGFGLGVVIFTSSSVSELAPRLPHAMVGTNGPCVGTQGTPWLGRGRSGFGLLGSLDGHRLFAMPQVITTRN